MFEELDRVLGGECTAFGSLNKHQQCRQPALFTSAALGSPRQECLCVKHYLSARQQVTRGRVNHLKCRRVESAHNPRASSSALACFVPGKLRQNVVFPPCMHVQNDIAIHIEPARHEMQCLLLCR